MLTSLHKKYLLWEVKLEENNLSSNLFLGLGKVTRNNPCIFAGEKRVVCKYCEKRYRDMRTLRLHMAQVHKDYGAMYK